MKCRFLVVVLMAAILSLLSVPSQARGQLKLVKGRPDNDSPAELLCASPLGGSGSEQIVGAAVLPDGRLLLAGNSGIQSIRGRGRHARSGNGKGFLQWLAVGAGGVKLRKRVGLSGQVNRLKLDPAGNVCVLLDGRTVYMLAGDGGEVVKSRSGERIDDFAVDANGQLVVLAGKRLYRFDKSWRDQVWSVSWHAHGGNRPGGMALDPKTGVASVVGYGMTHTGREPWKDPYGYGFDREGKQIWKLWDPKPSKQVAGQHGGNGLMADTTGEFAQAGWDGTLLLHYYADGGNSVCTRTPADPDEKMPSGVYEGVYQSGPGWGFRGASQTSAIFRVAPTSGKLLKGTWMCSWLTPQRANGLGMDDATSDREGTTFVVGNSASGCPTKSPWFSYSEGYMGGGFLAIFSEGLQMRQCGFFQQTSMRCVAVGGGYIVAAGDCKSGRKSEGAPLRVHRPVQDDFGGGESDGFFIVLRYDAARDFSARFARGGAGFSSAAHGGVDVDAIAAEKAAEGLAEARRLLEAGEKLRARRALHAVAARYPQTEAGREARAMVEKLLAEARQRQPRRDPAEVAAGKLRVARSYLANRMTGKARSLLEEIVEKYGRTPAAEKARQLLRELG